MLTFALNHMTVPALSLRQAQDLARDLQMVGLELRNDLDRPLFDGQAPAPLADLTVFAVAEVKAFNAFTDDTMKAALALMDQAQACGAKAISLIPQVGGTVYADGLRTAMTELGPELAQRGLVGLIEPIGFGHSTLRYKWDVVTLMDTLDVGDSFGLIHDTFHHFLSGEETLYPDHTKLVHISGVSDHGLPIAEITDAHRGLVDGNDRLGNIDQINDLMRGGYDGPLSFECFSTDVHADIDPKEALSRSIRFIETAVLTRAA